MPQIINEIGAGERIGAALGSGLSSGLQQLAQNKLNQISQRNQQKKTALGLESLGIPKEQAEQVSGLPQELIAHYLKQRSQESQNQLFSKAFAGAQGSLGQGNDLSSLLQGLNPQNARIVAEQQNKNRQFDQQVKQAEEANNLKRQQLGQRQNEFGAKYELESRKHQESQSIKQQEKIRKQNSPFVERLSKEVPINKEINQLASEMLSLLDTGKVGSGYLSSKLPNAFVSPEQQRFEALANQVAALSAAKGGGATNFKTQLALMSKPNVAQKPEARRKLLQGIIDKSNAILAQDEARLSIIDEHGGEEPANLESLVKKRLHQVKKQSAAPSEPASDFEEGTEVEYRGKHWIVKNGQWMGGE